jgi:hypothetical protein
VNIFFAFGDDVFQTQLWLPSLIFSDFSFSLWQLECPSRVWQCTTQWGSQQWILYETNSMEQSSSWEANRSSTTRAMPRILWSLKFRHCIPKSLLTEYEMLYCKVVHFITNICGCRYWKWLVERVYKVLEESKLFKLHWQYVWKTLLYKMSLSYTLLVFHATTDTKYIFICTDVGACGIESEICNLEKLW